MALDFAVLTDDETAADFVSLGMQQHDRLMSLALELQLPALLRFNDYCEEVDVMPADLPALSEELHILSKSAAPCDLTRFALDLRALIALAARRGKALMTVPD